MWQYVSLGIIGFTSFGIFILRRIFRGKVIYCYCTPRHKRNIVITGANSGIGKATALELAKKNCNLILACRDIVNGEKTRLEIINLTQNRNIVVKPLDLSSVASIQQFVAGIADQRIDVLINNAGIFGGHLRQIPDFSTEEDMAVNHLGHFLLTTSLLPHLLDSHNTSNGLAPRVVIVSSSLAKRGSIDPEKLDFSATKYSPRQAYANSKLANCLFARELHARYHRDQQTKGSNGGGTLNVYTLQTAGMVNTNLARHSLQKLPFLVRPLARLLAWRLLKNPYEGCQTVVHCAISEDLELESGLLYANCDPIEWPSQALDKDLARHLWDNSLKIFKKSE